MRNHPVMAALAAAILLSGALPVRAEDYDVDRPGAQDERRPGTMPDARRPGAMPDIPRPGAMPKERKPGTIGRDDQQEAGAAERRGIDANRSTRISEPTTETSASEARTRAHERRRGERERASCVS